MTTQQTGPQTGPQAAASAASAAAERVLVGVDGSPSSRSALVWALARAGRSGARVEVVSAYPVDYYWGDPFLVDTRRLNEIRSQAEARVHSFLDEVRRDPALASVPGAAQVEVDVRVVGGAPAQHLVDRARGAQVLVVGSRGRGTLRSALLGSVALHCITHAPAPVVVMRGDLLPEAQARVVVGVDDSDISRTVVRRARDEAERLGARLVAVAVCPMPAYWGDSYEATALLAAEGREQVRNRAEALVEDFLGPGVGVQVAEGNPAEVLLDRSAGAALLVVGSRSRSTLTGTVLGSVALHCAVHATCPVMVVHPDDGPPPAGTAVFSTAASGIA